MKYFFDAKDEILDQIGGRSCVIFLDYDGTLTPIVDTPDLAILDNDVRSLVSKLSDIYDVAIVSGRATDDVRGKVGIDGIFYAGSHGFEIISPDSETFIQPDVKSLLPSIDHVFSQIQKALAPIEGALVEHVKYTVSCHYRRVDLSDVSDFKNIIDDVLKAYPDLKLTHGKKVYEIRPRLDWHKGRAVRWMSNVLNAKPTNQALLYIGDDTTDEDAFDEVSFSGVGVCVTEKPRQSKAQYYVKDPGDVKKVLEFLIEKSQ